MGSKTIASLGLFLAVVLLITSEVTARDLAEAITSTEAAEQTNGFDDAKYVGGPSGGGGIGGGHGSGGPIGGGTIGGGRGGGGPIGGDVAVEVEIEAAVTKKGVNIIGANI